MIRFTYVRPPVPINIYIYIHLLHVYENRLPGTEYPGVRDTNDSYVVLVSLGIIPIWPGIQYFEVRAWYYHIPNDNYIYGQCGS